MVQFSNNTKESDNTVELMTAAERQGAKAEAEAEPGASSSRDRTVTAGTELLTMDDEALASIPWYTRWWRLGFRRGDIDAFSGLQFDNMGTLMVVTGFLRLMGATDEIVYQRVLPGAAFSILFGNFYYAFQAYRLQWATKRSDVTAQPYGINTPGSFVKIALVFAPALAKTGDPMTAYEIALSANFLSGVIETLGALIGGWLRDHTPTPALLSTLGGIGIVWLTMMPFITLYKNPIPGMLPLIIIILGYFGKVRWPFNIPTAPLAVVVGTVLDWSLGDKTGSELEAAAKMVDVHFPLWTGGVVFSRLPDAITYLPAIIPVAVTNFLGTIECVESAHQVGDEYSVRESLIVDGVGTILGSMFGSMFGTTIYIGHATWKEMGARSGYSIANGSVLFLASVFGLVAPLFALLSLVGVSSIVWFVGLFIAKQSFDVSSSIEYPAVLLGIIPTICDWGAQQISQKGGTPDPGLASLGSGALLTGMCWAALFIVLVRREWMNVSLWSFALAAAAFVGLIHSSELEWRTDGDDWEVSMAYLTITIFGVTMTVLEHQGWYKLISRDGELTEEEKKEELERRRASTRLQSHVFVTSSSITAAVQEASTEYRGSVASRRESHIPSVDAVTEA
eukprot:GFYU01006334.1.p1 GENE.GFYU01006334.1~~GFYU01006334.1.p1  ORF type:complete len:622 (+),score=98.24 GFYU01006334.1:69-1934(+)